MASWISLIIMSICCRAVNVALLYLARYEKYNKHHIYRSPLPQLNLNVTSELQKNYNSTFAMYWYQIISFALCTLSKYNKVQRRAMKLVTGFKNMSDNRGF